MAFNTLGLSEKVLAAVEAAGYKEPTAIQSGAIPQVLERRDILGIAQTGTGKTAAFALPVLAGMDISLRATQALILTPTRELALQVAEAFQRYDGCARSVRGLRTQFQELRHYASRVPRT